MPLLAVCERRGPWGEDGIGSGDEAAARVGASGDAPHTSHAASDVLSLPQTAQTIERILSQRSFAEESPAQGPRLGLTMADSPTTIQPRYGRA